jgi:polyhydroxyalkanoate synthase
MRRGHPVPAGNACHAAASGACCPPPIGRFYFLDLRPERSFVEYAVSRGLQTLMLSWRNPGPEQAGWDLEVHARRVLSAIEVAREVTGSPDVDVIGFCAGGIITTTVLNHLAAAAMTGWRRPPTR